LSRPSNFAITSGSASYDAEEGFYRVTLNFNARRASGGIGAHDIDIVGAGTLHLPAQSRPAGTSVIFNSGLCAPDFLGAGPVSLHQITSPSPLERESDGQPCTNVEGFVIPVV
jgi:hypothetical protein